MPVGPKGPEGVWLKHGWAKTAHRLTQPRPVSKTPCGLRTYQNKHGIGERLGQSIRWDFLDQQAVDLCKICWKDYEPVDSRTINELKWWAAQHDLVAEIFSEAWVVASVPTHLDDFNKASIEPGGGPGGNVVARGTMLNYDMLNYDTLRSMLRIMLEEETHRKGSRAKMVKLMESLTKWEKAHPYGQPIRAVSLEELPLIAEALFGS